MAGCWEHEPDARPKITQVLEQIRGLFQTSREADNDLRDVAALAVLAERRRADPNVAAQWVCSDGLEGFDFSDTDPAVKSPSAEEEEVQYLVVGDVPSMSSSDPAPRPKREDRSDASATRQPQRQASRSRRPITAGDVGRRCTVEGYQCDGVLRFVGPYAETGRTRCGVELDDPEGKNNGQVKGKQYFQCKPGHGVLVVPTKVHLIPRRERAPPLSEQIQQSKSQERVSTAGASAKKKPKPWTCSIQ